MGPMLKITSSRGAISKNTLKVIIMGHRNSLSYLIFSWYQRTVIIYGFISYLLRNVALSFRWKLYKPFFRCPVSPGFHAQPSVGSSQVPRTPEDLGVFFIAPNMGTIPPHQSVDFILEFSPREVSTANWVSRFSGRPSSFKQ